MQALTSIQEITQKHNGTDHVDSRTLKTLQARLISLEQALHADQQGRQQVYTVLMVQQGQSNLLNVTVVC